MDAILMYYIWHTLEFVWEDGANSVFCTSLNWDRVN